MDEFQLAARKLTISLRLADLKTVALVSRQKMLLAAAILVVLALACFAIYRLLDLALAAVFEANIDFYEKSALFANKAVSAVHGVCVSLFAIAILISGDWQKNGQVELVDSRHRGMIQGLTCIGIARCCGCSCTNCLFTGTAVLVCWEMAYLAHDTISILRSSRMSSRNNILFLVHHIGLLCVLPIYFKYEKGDFYIASMFLQYLSNPLLHSSYFLRKSKLNGSLLHKFAAVLLIAVFFGARVALWPVLLRTHCRAIGVPFQEVFHHMRIYCIAAMLAMFILNSYWCMLLLWTALSQDLRATYNPHKQLASSSKED